MSLVLLPPTERDSLPARLAALGRARKRTAVAIGAFVFVAVFVAGLALAGFLDAAFHLPPLARGLALAIVLTASGVVWLAGLSRALRLRTDALTVALELEERFPVLNDSLASAVSFLAARGGRSLEDAEDEAERRGVSHRLRTSAVRAAERKAGPLPLDQFVPTGRFWRAAWACAAILAVAIPLAVWNTGRAATAMVRLADPFGTHPWPTKTRIEFTSPAAFPVRIPKGEGFELRFEVRGVLNGPATLHLRQENGPAVERKYPLALNNDPTRTGAAVVTVQLEPAEIPSNFSVRVTANDADTGWKDVRVVPPPRLVPLDGRPSPQFHITPPAYTGLPARELYLGDRPDGAGVIEVPVGTVVRFRAATDVPVVAATLGYTGDRSMVTLAAPVAHLGHLNPLTAVAAGWMAANAGADIPLGITAGTRLSATFVPLFSGKYALRLTDDTGLTGTITLEIRLRPDPPPEVTLRAPLTGQHPTMLTPAASIDFAMTAEDPDYGVRCSFIEYRIGPDGPVRTIPLSEVSRIPTKPLVAAAGGLGVALETDPARVEVERVIPLARFLRDDGTPVREGDVITLWAAADDWDDYALLKGPGRSRGGREHQPVRTEIHVVSPEAIEAWLQKELTALRGELLELRSVQRAAWQKVDDIAPQPDGTLKPEDRLKLITADPVQRQARTRGADLTARADLLLATVRANRLASSNVTDRVERVAPGVQRITDRLRATETTLADALRLMSQPVTPGGEGNLAAAIRRVTRYQRDVEDTATSLIDLLSQWGGAGEIRADARSLRDELLSILAANEKLKALIPTGKIKLTEEELQELERLARRVEAAAERGSNLMSRATRFAADKDALASALLVEAAIKQKEADDLREKARMATNPLEQSELVVKANEVDASVIELRAAAVRATVEATALRIGVRAALGQGFADELRDDAARAVRANRLHDGTGAAQLLRDAVARLDAMIEALTEREPDAVPELTKPAQFKAAAEALQSLANAQDELRKRVEEAMKIADPTQRAARLKELAKEQDKLIARARDLVNQLTRDKSPAAKDARDALDRMEAARDNLERGLAGDDAQWDAVDKLDIARNKLIIGAANVGRQLADEKRRQLANRVKLLVEKQKAAVAEATRIHAEAAKLKEWTRPLLSSYQTLDELREKEVVAEIRVLAAGEFAPHLVLVRLLTDAAGAIDTARERIKRRCDDADLAAAYDEDAEAALDKQVLAPMLLALRRLEQLADALKDDPKQTGGPKLPQQPPKGQPNQPGGAQDLVPAAAQLKVLDALQAEVETATARFLKDHPDLTMLTPAEQEEWKSLLQAQRELTELYSGLNSKREPTVEPKRMDEPKKDAPPPEKP